MYTPNNVCVYLKAYVGAFGGLAAVGKFLLDPGGGAAPSYARMADAYAQAIDAAWGDGEPTGAEEDALEHVSAGTWGGRSPLGNAVAFEPGAYAGVAAGVVAAVRASSAQIAAEGIDLDGCAPQGAAHSVLIVPNIAALSALVVTALSDGQPARVQSNGSKWELTTSTVAVDGITVASSPSAGRVWQRSGSYIQEQATSQGTWVIDPQAGNDEASGLTSGTALKTFAELVRRWGTLSPVFQSPTTIAWLNDAPSTDAFAGFAPITGPAGSLLLQGTPALVTTVTLGIYTAINPAAGTSASVSASGKSGAFWTPFVGLLAVGQTSGARFWIDTDLGGAVAGITNPLLGPVDAGATYATPVNGETLALYRFPIVFVASLAPLAGIRGVVFQQLQLTSVAAGAVINGTLLATWAIECAFAGSSFRIGNGSIAAISCKATAGFSGFSGLQGPWAFQGGSVSGAGPQFTDTSSFEGDVLIHQRIHFTSGILQFFRCYFGETPDTDIGVATFVLNEDGSGAYDASKPIRLWGPGGLTMRGGSRVFAQGAMTNRLLLRGTLATDAPSGLGYAFNPTTGAFSTGTSVTASAIDASAGKSLLNPATGSGFFSS